LDNRQESEYVITQDPIHIPWDKNHIPPHWLFTSDVVMEAYGSSGLSFIGMYNISFIIMWPLHNQSYCNISMKTEVIVYEFYLAIKNQVLLITWDALLTSRRNKQTNEKGEIGDRIYLRLAIASSLNEEDLFRISLLLLWRIWRIIGPGCGGD
jgi:hypothetical protein